MNRLIGIISSLAAAFLFPALSASAQGSGKDNVYGEIVQFDKTIHNFGDILLSDGPVKASFKAKNVSSKPMLIYNVASSCGCTDVEWTKQPVNPGESAVITATYKNDEGGYPFDKTLTVYVSGVKQPIVLRLRGESHDKKLSLKELYPVRFGNLGLKEVEIKAGNLSQGQQKSGETDIANLGTRPLTLTFADVSEGLDLKVADNPIPAGGTTTLSYTVTADRRLWGKNWYYAVPLIDGRRQKAVCGPSQARKEAGAEAVVADPNPLLGNGSEKIGIYAITKEDFLSWTKEEKDRASQPMADESTFDFGKVKAGTKVSGSFTIRNQGKSTLKVYKIDSESSRIALSYFPDVPSGSKKELKFTFDTQGMPSGEVLVVLSLITNSPLRPIMNLFLAGWIE